MTPDASTPARLVPAHYTVADVPHEVSDADRSPDGRLPVGAPGKIGLLELGFRRDGATRRTELAHRYQKSPLQVMRPLYCDPELPGVPVVYVMSTGGGVVGGDRLRLDVAVEAQAHAVVTTQAATKVHRTDSAHATQRVELSVAPGAICEYLPDPLIPFAGSRFHQSLRGHIADGATLVLSDVVAAGRLGRGEHWGLDAYTSTVELSRPGGAPLVVDTTRLVGAEAGGGAAVMGDDRVVGTLIVVTPGTASPGTVIPGTAPPGTAVSAAALADALHEAAAGACPGVRAGASTLPGDCGAWVRVLGRELEPVQRAVTAAWSVARLRYAGAPAPDLRKS